MKKYKFAFFAVLVLFIAYIGYNYYDKHKSTDKYYVVRMYNERPVVHRDRHCKKIKGGVEIVSKKKEFSSFYVVCPECFTDEQWEEKK